MRPPFPLVLTLALLGVPHAATAQELAPAPPPLRLADVGLDLIVPGAFDPLAGVLLIERHTVAGHAIAYYLPSQRIELAAADATTPPADPSADPAVDAPLADLGPATAVLEVPARLLVLERLYAPEGRLRPLAELTVDTAEYLLHALLEALLDLSATRMEETLTSAEQWFPDVPVERRREAVVEAYADFGAHLVSVANEIGRRRLESEDPQRLCAAAARGIGLFSLWVGAFERQPFPGSYYRSSSGEPGALPSERIYSAHSLPKAARLAFVREVLLRPWTGDARVDLLGELCDGR